MRWRFWRKPQVDLGKALMVEDILSVPLANPELHGHFTVGRAAEKAAKRAAQGKPPHRIRTVPLEELRANPRASYRGMPTDELPPWAREHE